MNRIPSILCSFVKMVNPTIAALGFILAVILAIYPRILEIDNGRLNNDTFESLKSKMSVEAVNFVEQNLNADVNDVKILIKAIPDTISTEDRNYLLDIIDYRVDYRNIHSLLVYAAFLLLTTAVIVREFYSGRKFAVAHSIEFLHQAIHCLRDGWVDIFRYNEATGRIGIDMVHAKEKLSNSLTRVENYFSSVTGSPCMVCLWVASGSQNREEADGALPTPIPLAKERPPNADIKVRLFARGESAKVLEFNRKKTPDGSDADVWKDFICNNSDFKAIAVDQRSFFLKNNIDRGNYAHSFINASSKRKKSRQLGFRSVITFGIRTWRGNEPEVFGFMGVYSPFTNMFDRRLDLPPGNLITDFYALFIRKYLAVGQVFQEEENENVSSARSE